MLLCAINFGKVDFYKLVKTDYEVVIAAVQIPNLGFF